MLPPQDLTGKVFNYLTVLRYIPTKERIKNTNAALWECVCICGNIVNLKTAILKTQKSCGCIKHGKKPKRSGIRHWNWHGTKHIPRSLFHRIKRITDVRNKRQREIKIDFIITIDDLEKLWIKQKGLCALTNQQLTIINGTKGTASLDRIDSSKGYIPGNIQWVLKEINLMKNSYTQEHFIELCKAVVTHCS